MWKVRLGLRFGVGSAGLPCPTKKGPAMRINGRILRPSNLSERRLLLSVGAQHVRVPRSMNPYAVARQLARLAKGGDLTELRKLVASTRRPPCPGPFPIPSPDLDEPERWPLHVNA